MFDYEVRRVKSSIGKEFIRQNHYSRTCHNGPRCYGLFNKEELIGVCAFANPASEAVRASVFGAEHVSRVTELHRLFVMDGTPTNTESWFVSRVFRSLLEDRPDTRAVISFADSTEGHVGTVYQALNALYCGTTARARFWRDNEGRLRHPRQNGHNVTAFEAKELGWVPEYREAKHRYVFIVGLPAEKRAWRKRLLLTTKEYPKRG